jgi:hypothetical protein
MAPTEGHLIPEKSRNSKTPLHAFMLIFYLIHWNIIAEQTNEYAEWRMEQQFLNNGKRTISRSKWDHDTTYQEIINFYGMLIFMCLFPFPGATYTAY